MTLPDSACQHYVSISTSEANVKLEYTQEQIATSWRSQKVAKYQAYEIYTLPQNAYIPNIECNLASSERSSHFLAFMLYLQN